MQFATTLEVDKGPVRQKPYCGNMTFSYLQFMTVLLLNEWKKNVIHNTPYLFVELILSNVESFLSYMVCDFIH